MSACSTARARAYRPGLADPGIEKENPAVHDERRHARRPHAARPIEVKQILRGIRVPINRPVNNPQPRPIRSQLPEEHLGIGAVRAPGSYEHHEDTRFGALRWQCLGLCLSASRGAEQPQRDGEKAQSLRMSSLRNASSNTAGNCRTVKRGGDRGQKTVFGRPSAARPDRCENFGIDGSFFATSDAARGTSGWPL